MDRNEFDETAPGEIVPTTTRNGTYSAFQPDPLPPTINTDTTGRKPLNHLATPGWRVCLRSYVRQYEQLMRLFEEPCLDVNTAATGLAVEYSTANRLVGHLEDDGILEELTGKARNRFYRASEIFEIINKPIGQL